MSTNKPSDDGGMVKLEPAADVVVCGFYSGTNDDLSSLVWCADQSSAAM